MQPQARQPAKFRDQQARNGDSGLWEQQKRGRQPPGLIRAGQGQAWGCAGD